MTRLPYRISRLCRWRVVRWAVAAPALPFLLWACTSHDLIQPHPAPEAENAQYFEVNPIRDIDILFMIDDSPSMQDKQANLRKNFPVFIQALQMIPGGLPSVHIGVVTSDLGSGPTNINGNQCVPGGKRGILRTGTNCGLDPNSRFIVAGQGVASNFTGDISTVFQCMATVGAEGCGFEHQLQAIRVALYPDVTPQNAGFLRPNAYLGIVILTDEDDCSAPPDSNLFTDDASFPGTTPSFRCAQVGHLCGGQPPPVGPYTHPLSDCTPVEKGRLISVQEIVTSIRNLKSNPDNQILVSAISGMAPDPTKAVYAYGKELGPDMMVKSNNIDYLPICYAIGTDNMPLSATAPLRVKEFVDAFGSNGSFNTICSNDFSGAMKIFADKLIEKVLNTCVAAPVKGASGDDGKGGDCVVTDTIPTSGGGSMAVNLPNCSSNQRPCWALVKDPNCAASHYHVNIDRGGMPAAAGTQESIKCATCANPGDPACTLPP